MSTPQNEFEASSAQAIAALLERAKHSRECGDIAEALRAYREVLDRPHCEQTAEAAFRMGEVLKTLGDSDGAIDAFRRGMNAGDIPYMSTCAINLSVILEKRGDLAGA